MEKVDEAGKIVSIEEAKAKTVAQGVTATKKWHKQNPYPKKK